jgi:Bacterial protein of unknown function (DUF922)
MTMPFRLVAVASLASVLVACASGAAATMPGAVAMPRAAVVTSEPFEWAAERRLTWADFQGAPDLRSGAVAVTATVVEYEMHCTGTDFRWRIVSRFVPRSSWVKPDHLVIRQSEQTLLHEQGHYDLSEVHARRARGTLRNLAAPCALTDAQQNALIQGFHKQADALQEQYDRETAHGTAQRRQREWEVQVEEWLRTIPK